MGSSIGDALAQEVIARYASGLSCRRIAEQLPVSAATARRVLIENDVVMRPHGRRRPHPEARGRHAEGYAMCRLYTEHGASLELIAAVAGCSVSTVRARLLATLAELRPRGAVLQNGERAPVTWG